MIERMQQILAFLRQYQREHQYPPTIQEVAVAVQANKGTTYHTLNRMAVLGLVTHRGHVPRSYYLRNEPYPKWWR